MVKIASPDPPEWQSPQALPDVLFPPLDARADDKNAGLNNNALRMSGVLLQINDLLYFN
jgi:hypothetical protein